MHSQIHTASLVGSWPRRAHYGHLIESPLLSPLERSAEDLQEQQNTFRVMSEPVVPHRQAHSMLFFCQGMNSAIGTDSKCFYLLFSIFSILAPLCDAR